MLVSVCIPVYNGAHSIARLVGEVARALGKQAVEFVLVNDGSRDASDAVCAELALIRKPRDLYLSSFKAIARPLIDEIIKYTGPFPYIDGLILRATSSISSVVVEHKARPEGRSNYTLGRLVTLWLNMFVNFSIRPMRAISLLGICTSAASFILAVVFLIDKIRHPATPAGWASLALLVLFLGGIQTMALGIIGEYIGKNYLDRNGTPQWTIKTITRAGSKS